MCSVEQNQSHSEERESADSTELEMFGLFGDLDEGELDPLQIDTYEDESSISKKIEEHNVNIYCPLKMGGTKLHEAIRRGKHDQIESLISAYQQDYDKIRDYLVSKHNWNTENRVWLNKYILIAKDSEQAKLAKSLENSNISPEQICDALFVLFLDAVENEKVAIIYPSENKQLEVYKLIKQLLPNGCLSWNYFGTEDGRYRGIQQTFVELAAFHGNNSAIKRLIGLGAKLAFPGHNALIAACQSLKKDTIRYLLTEHFNDFDCTIRDNRLNNAVMALLQKHDAKMLEYVVEKMIEYRMQHYSEDQIQAFDKIFRFEDADLSCLSIFTYVSKPLYATVEKLIERYQLNLSYQWEGVTILICLLSKKLALKYCYDGIRKNPSLLGLISHGDYTVLHKLEDLGSRDFIQELYFLHPEVKAYFETSYAFVSLCKAFDDIDIERVKFIMEHHADYLYQDIDRLKENVVCCKCTCAKVYKKSYSLRVQFFPEFKSEIEALSEELSRQQYYDVTDAFSKHCITKDLTEETLKDIDAPGNIRGFANETLVHLAVKKDDLNLLRYLLQRDSDIDNVDDDGNHAVHYVNSTEMLNFLIEKCAEGKNIVNRKNAQGKTILHLACITYTSAAQQIELIHRIVECGADINELTSDGENALFFICHCELLDIFISYGINLDVVNKEDETCLGHHLSHQRTCVATKLLPIMYERPSFEKHAHKYLDRMFYRNRDFFYCDYQWLLEKRPDITKCLFDSLYHHSREESARVFNRACGGAFNFIVEKFLDYNYDLDYNAVDDHGYTPIIGLLSYMEEPNLSLIERLLEKPVDLTMRNNWGKTAIVILADRFSSAKWYGHNIETFQLLLTHGADINATDDDGNTALHHCVKNGEWELGEYLLANGADRKLRNNEGKVPFEMKSTIYQDVFKFLCF